MILERLIGPVVMVALLGASCAATAQQAPVYTAAQARQGKTAYLGNCAMCHGAHLDDGQFGPPLSGQTFAQRWAGRSLAELDSYLETSMPPALAGQLSRDTYVSVIAYLLQQNKVKAGSRPVPARRAALSAMVLPGKRIPDQLLRRGNSPGGPITAGVKLPSWPAPPNPLDHYTPVTEAMLNHPPKGDWLTWRRTRDDLGFSPLDQIDKRNVRELQLAWSISLPAGPNAATPLVHDGVIFVHSFGDNVQAFDAATGHELWHYGRELPNNARPTVKRNMALYGDKLFVGTSDVHVVALDVKTGHVLWDRQIAPPGVGWALTGGPLVAHGKVLQGINGQAPGGAWIVGLDANTGKQLWRFYSIARPGAPNGNSWNGLPLDKRSGGSVWTAGSYDPQLNLAYFGPAPTYDTGPMRDRIDKPGVTNDALYTDTTVALNPDTGKLVWYYQHVRNDQWDYDWAFERQIVDLPVHGRQEKVVVTAGKEALFDVLNAANGHYVDSFDAGLQTLISSVNPKTGAKTIDPALIPSRERAVTVCPHAGGAKSWLPGSIDPATHVLYEPLVESCQDLTPAPKGERGGLSTGVRFSIRPRPDSDGRYGRVQAIDLTTGKTIWTARHRAPQSAGVLATAGGLVFSGSIDREFRAHDAATGKVLWRTRLDDVPSAAPITYAVGGKQYVAMVVGFGSPQSVTFTALTPEIQLPLKRSSTLFVFTLPSSR